MKKSAYILVLILLTSLFVNAQTQNVELGLQVGAGFFLGNKAPAPGVTRLYEFAWVPDTKEFPAFEAFGGFARYRFNQRWAVQLQAMHQRVRFTEYDKCHFYNSMWNTDMMAEFNILKYGFVDNPNLKVYTITPYVAVGFGASLYNKTATYRWGMKDGAGKQNTYFPAVKANDLTAALYVPFGIGMKLRMEQHWQLKVACQYDLYLLNGNVDGSTITPNKKDANKYYPYPDGMGVNYQADNYKYKVASTHNIVATIAVIYNLPSDNREGIIIDY